MPSYFLKEGHLMKYILLDKDGTLLDFHTTWVPFAKQMASDFAKEQAFGDREEELLRDLGYIDGVVQPNSVLAAGSDDDFQAVFKKYGDFEAVSEWMSNYYYEHIEELMQNVQMVEGTRDTVIALHNMGYKVVICTNDGRKSTKIFVEKFGLEDYVFDLICGDDTEFSKPHSGMLKPFMETHDAKIHEMIMVGDNSTDTLLGEDLGLKTIGVLSGTGHKESLLGASDVIKSINDMIVDGKFIYHNE